MDGSGMAAGVGHMYVGCLQGRGYPFHLMCMPVLQAEMVIFNLCKGELNYIGMYVYVQIDQQLCRPLRVMLSLLCEY